MSAFQSSQLKKKKWKNAHRIQGHPLIARLRGWFFVRNNISIWQTLSLNNCRKQRKTFRFSWLDETCSQLQPDKQQHGLQKLFIEGWDVGTTTQELGNGLHRHWHDLLHWVSSLLLGGEKCWWLQSGKLLFHLSSALSVSISLWNLIYSYCYNPYS